ncbi:hypothetical protein A3A03_00385 [Candidatus Nomurabacteria bacterium RIFCSPLOWO2_01_FULL_40_18]|uniref:UDP-N-acetylmuramoyl-L-alanyl-D-glutamate--2,6-diaminopimelate ligase n=1 Tax=Candidatus Nomurabacteria bacterium RIFCSPLOWO2_01_FULL_40_18 TaxID=1801773 RepID=A0A1F6XHJ0_9BACT|nr:MAG: hypothetical protein A3A03_00385 [Candidatus Nomurabacteria bacterium RIFCSPLOWO2_01_FULL_40_18]
MKNIFKKLSYANWSPVVRRFVNVCIGLHIFGYPYKELKIIGVTGTNGKTTISTLLYNIAIDLGYKAGLIGTVDNLVNGRKIITDFTTPEAFELNKILSEMVKEGCEYVFMEVSSHGMEERRVAGLKFIGGIFTNLTQDHLDYHLNMENYFSAKKKFFQMLPKEAFALTNTDDEYGKKMLEGIKARKFTYEFSDLVVGVPSGNFHGEIKKSNFNGWELDFNSSQVKSKLLGRFNAYNLLAVWSACELLGFDIEKVKKIIEDIKPPRGRFDHFTSESGVLAVVDYAHTPDALQNVLLTIQEIKPKESRVISVFGCGGDRDSSKRPKMGRIGVALSDIPIFTSDNPRSEDPNKIIADMMAELYPEDMKKVKSIPNRHEAILEAVKLAQKGDIILCAGKGHEDYQEIQGVKNHFNDLEELQKAF